MKSLVCKQANPKLITWSRKSSGVSLNNAAKRVRLSSEEYTLVESGKKHLTLTQLRLLATLFKRPVAVFFLAKPPENTKRPRDFRGHKGELSTKTIISIRRSRRVQQFSKDLMPKGINVNLWQKGNTIKKDAELTRDWLGISEESQISSGSSKDFFAEISELLAEKETHVLLHSFPTNDAQAYSFPEVPRIITISTADSSVETRLFSLFHELYHIRLGESGICFTNTVHNRYRHERMCDEFATQVLMPEGLVRKLMKRALQQGLDLNEQLNFLSKSTKASKHALLIRLQELGYIDELQVSQQIAQWRQRTGRKVYGRTNRVATVLKENGKLYTSRVIEAYQNNRITTSDAANMLTINQTYLDKVGARVNEK